MTMTEAADSFLMLLHPGSCIDDGEVRSWE